MLYRLCLIIFLLPTGVLADEPIHLLLRCTGESTTFCGIDPCINSEVTHIIEIKNGYLINNGSFGKRKLNISENDITTLEVDENSKFKFYFGLDRYSGDLNIDIAINPDSSFPGTLESFKGVCSKLEKDKRKF